MAETQPTLLIFTKTADYQHKSIGQAVTHLQALLEKNGILADTTSDARFFDPNILQKYGAVMFLNTSGDVLSEEQQTAFYDYYRSGKGFVGIHCATCTEYDWKWYGQLVGTYFENHPKPQKATLNVLNRDHISTRHLPEQWERTDEWYNFTKPLSDDITVLIEVDEDTYEGGTHGTHHPFTWYHEFDGGRSWYTAGGHFEEHYADSLFAHHILGGILYALGND